ncbi:MAG: HEAT repeat domain-containing protein [Planctomycetes bacterium]|nr:HEAT repeat domain-containing protein [Planctomycetota bacterium]
MQLGINFKTVSTLAALGVLAYLAYDLEVFARKPQTGELARLQRLRTNYRSARDYAAVASALDSNKPEVQALAVEILSENVERPAVRKLLEMLGDTACADVVKEQLAITMGKLRVNEATSRLVALTARSEAHMVRFAAHKALQELTGAGAQVKFGDDTHEAWTMWLRSRHSGGTR